MKGNYYNNPINLLIDSNCFNEQQAQLSSLKIRNALKEQKKQFNRRLYGEHYNYSKVGLNKQKKYMLEEQRNTQIERSNRILFQKIQRIAKRSVPNIIKKRAITEDSYDEIWNYDEKMSFKNSRVIGNFKKVSLQQTQSNFNKLYSNDEKTPRNDKKIIFKTNFDFNGKIYSAKAYFDLNKYVLLLETAKMNQKIKLDLDNYKTFYVNCLNKNHQKILEFLKFNGTIFELKSQIQQNLYFQQEQYITLPCIENKNDNRQKYIDKSQSILQSSLNF